MDTLLKADIFFFVTTIAVIVVLILLCVALVYLVGILKNIKNTARKINSGIDSAHEEIIDIKNRIVDDSFLNFIFKKKKKKKSSND